MEMRAPGRKPRQLSPLYQWEITEHEDCIRSFREAYA